MEPLIALSLSHGNPKRPFNQQNTNVLLYPGAAPLTPAFSPFPLIIPQIFMFEAEVEALA